MVQGTPRPSAGTVQAPLGRHPTNRQRMAVRHLSGKRAVTHYETLQTLGPLSHLKAVLETGRTHQIRVHLSQALKTPVLNDQTYGRSLEGFEHPFLHARTLGFTHPITKKDLLFEAPPPEVFQRVWLAFYRE